ncbi:ATP-binding protein [Streptomyces sp. NPDC048361]|uniref:ATP-binding protein n=1 Tax=Streptomyces sp. NPDC048361 TaxID=3154720 RepID=UPI0034430A54
MTVTALTPPAPPDSTPTRTHRLTTPNRPTAAAELRAIVAALLRVAGHAPLAESARLCTSELVTNVHRHTGARLVHVEVVLGEGEVTVRVYDDQARPLPPPVPSGTGSALRECGRGLLLVDELADAWGTTHYGAPRPTSKAVWFRMVRGGRGAS